MPVGTKYSYSDTTTQIRSVLNVFDLMSPREVPFLKLISGGSDDTPSLNSLDAPCEQTKYEWIEDADPVNVTTLGAAIADGTTTSVTIAAGYVGNINEGRILLIEAEMVYVTVAGSNPLTVIRGWGGTTAVAHANGVAVTVIGRAHKEGDDAPKAVYQYPIMPFNYVQEFTDTILVTEIEQAIKRYGIDSAIEYEAERKARQLFQDMERQCFYGARVQPSSTNAGAFGGLETYIPAANKIAGGGASLTAAMINNAMKAVVDAVGQSQMPDTILVNTALRPKLSQLYSTYNTTTFRDQSERRGGVRVDTVTTDYGEMDVLLCNYMPQTKVFFVRKDMLGIGPLRDQTMRREMLAKTGTADKWMITGAYTLQVRGSACHALIDNVIP